MIIHLAYKVIEVDCWWCIVFYWFLTGVGTVAAMEILSYFSGTDDWLVNFK